MIIGHGKYQYELNTNWVSPKEQRLKLKDCHEMVQSANGNLYMLGNETANNIIIFDENGQIVDSWGHDYPGGHGLTLHEENGVEYLYITDTVLNKVFKTTLDGTVLMEINPPSEILDYADPSVFKPTEVLVTGNGDIYVTDGYGLQFVIQYDAKGKYIRHFGGRGEGASNLDCAHGIALDNRGSGPETLLVTSRNENAFKRYSLDGKYLGTIHVPGSFVCRPVVNGQNIYAAVFRSGDNQNFGSGYLTILDENNKVISSPGASEPLYNDEGLIRQQQLAGVFIHPHDVCVGRNGDLYVPQWNAGQVYPAKLTRI